MKTNRKNTVLKILPILLVLFWVGCEDLDFSDPNNPTAEAADITVQITTNSETENPDWSLIIRRIGLTINTSTIKKNKPPRGK